MIEPISLNGRRVRRHVEGEIRVLQGAAGSCRAAIPARDVSNRVVRRLCRIRRGRITTDLGWWSDIRYLWENRNRYEDINSGIRCPISSDHRIRVISSLTDKPEIDAIAITHEVPIEPRCAVPALPYKWHFHGGSKGGVLRRCVAPSVCSINVRTDRTAHGRHVYCEERWIQRI